MNLLKTGLKTVPVGHKTEANRFFQAAAAKPDRLAQEALDPVALNRRPQVA